MKKLLTIFCTFAIILLIVFQIASCKKSTQATTGCIANGLLIQTNVMFWISKDLGCGTLKVSKIHNKTTASESYLGGGTIDRYFNSQPSCKSTGTINIQVDKGYTYQYTIVCSSKSYSGEFTLNCNDDCVAIEVK